MECWSSNCFWSSKKSHDIYSSPGLLALPNFNKHFYIETCACDSGVGAVLTQEGHPVAYYSKSLGPANQKLSIYDKEFLAIIMAIERWSPMYVEVLLWLKTDHKSLCHLETQALTSDLQKKAMTMLIGLNSSSSIRNGMITKHQMLYLGWACVCIACSIFRTACLDSGNSQLLWDWL